MTILEKIEHILGWFEQEDIDAFAGLVLPKNPVIVECGTYCGRSTTVISLLWPDATIYTFDPVNEPQRVKGDWAYQNMKAQDSEWSAAIDLLFIDDSHYYDDIKANFEHFLPFVRPGGYVVFHDYCFETADVDGVRRFCNELGGGESYAGKYGGYIWQKPKN